MQDGNNVSLSVSLMLWFRAPEPPGSGLQPQSLPSLSLSASQSSFPLLPLRTTHLVSGVPGLWGRMNHLGELYMILSTGVF